MSLRWPGPVEIRLRELWAAGKSGQQIADALLKEFKFKITRRGVTGKAHRLGLDRRSNPIKNPRRLPRKPSGVSVTKTTPDNAKPAREHPGPVALRPAKECRWTDSTKAPWIFCGEECQAGSSYCPEHHARVYAVGLAADRQLYQGAAHDGTISSGSRRWNVKRSELKWGVS